jgi:hypothetical protein
MPIITLDLLKEGDVLATPVKNNVGQIIMPEGMTVLEKHIDRLKSFGVTQVEVVGAKKDEMDTLSPELIKAAEDAVRPLFKFNPLENANPWINQLFRVAAFHKAKKLKSKPLV